MDKKYYTMIEHGILMAGGAGSRLWPVTRAISKQLLPVYNKPLIYYSLGTLMLAGIRDVVIITTSYDNEAYTDLLGYGDAWGMQITYREQFKPEGIAQAFRIAHDVWEGGPVALMLGDNIFHGANWQKLLRQCVNAQGKGATVFAYPVAAPSRYGVVSLNSHNDPWLLEEKPEHTESNLAVTGLYLYDSTVWDKSYELRPSARGELEITDINREYMRDGELNVEILPRGMAWLDTGTADGLLQAANFVATLEGRQGQTIFCLEEIAYNNGWISEAEFRKAVEKEGPDYYRTIRACT